MWDILARTGGQGAFADAGRAASDIREADRQRRVMELAEPGAMETNPLVIFTALSPCAIISDGSPISQISINNSNDVDTSARTAECDGEIKLAKTSQSDGIDSEEIITIGCA